MAAQGQGAARDKLVAFYRWKEPGKVTQVDAILAAYAGREVEMFVELGGHYPGCQGWSFARDAAVHFLTATGRAAEQPPDLLVQEWRDAHPAGGPIPDPAAGEFAQFYPDMDAKYGTTYFTTRLALIRLHVEHADMAATSLWTTVAAESVDGQMAPHLAAPQGALAAWQGYYAELKGHLDADTSAWVTAFYSKHAPEKVGNVARILSHPQYAGRQGRETLKRDLFIAYDKPAYVAIATWSPQHPPQCAPNLRRALHEFVRARGPAGTDEATLLQQADDLAAQHAADPAPMLLQLIQSYDPEAAAAWAARAAQGKPQLFPPWRCADYPAHLAATLPRREDGLVQPATAPGAPEPPVPGADWTDPMQPSSPPPAPPGAAPQPAAAPAAAAPAAPAAAPAPAAAEAAPAAVGTAASAAAPPAAPPAAPAAQAAPPAPVLDSEQWAQRCRHLDSRSAAAAAAEAAPPSADGAEAYAAAGEGWLPFAVRLVVTAADGAALELPAECIDEVLAAAADAGLADCPVESHPAELPRAPPASQSVIDGYLELYASDQQGLKTKLGHGWAMCYVRASLTGVHWYAGHSREDTVKHLGSRLFTADFTLHSAPLQLSGFTPPERKHLSDPKYSYVGVGLAHPTRRLWLRSRDQGEVGRWIAHFRRAAAHLSASGGPAAQVCPSLWKLRAGELLRRVADLQAFAAAAEAEAGEAQRTAERRRAQRGELERQEAWASARASGADGRAGAQRAAATLRKAAETERECRALRRQLAAARSAAARASQSAEQLRLQREEQLSSAAQTLRQAEDAAAQAERQAVETERQCEAAQQEAAAIFRQWRAREEYEERAQQLLRAAPRPREPFLDRGFPARVASPLAIIAAPEAPDPLPPRPRAAPPSPPRGSEETAEAG
eukprot:TRINITY_DN3936_c4_g1_i2.p1 TRINITY_DN3936_c4_g1~~TRINITY_DN3936_c4_g1_i2.p1  ORF type:complete len:929 (+),score=276.92 TRINITY_DN3936_c4_g1_i2:97-2787(+)